MRSKIPNNEKIDKMLISKGDVVLGAPDRVHIPYLMHAIRLCQ